MMNSSVQATVNSGNGAPQLSTSPPVSSDQQQQQQSQQLMNSGQNLTAGNRGVQVQVLSGNSSQQQPAPGSTTLNEGGASANTSSQDLLSHLGGIRLAPEQQQQLLLAAQLQQQLRSSNVVIQPTLQGVTLLSTTSVPAATVTTATTSSTGTTQFRTQYGQDVSVLTDPSISGAQPTMMGGLPHTVVPSTAYYEPHHLSGQGLGPLEMGPSGHTSMTHTTRAHPETIQWLLENYETAEGVSLPRSTLYNHYLRHCAANKIDAVNAASFGKLIRSVFIGLKTRRLGTRGNSKYHYYGIRIKPDSPLNTFPTDDSVVAIRQPPQSAQRGEYHTAESTPEGPEGASQPAELTPQQQHRQYLGDGRPELIPFPEIAWSGSPLPGGLTPEDLNDFTAHYREHCEAILDVVVNLQFQMVENLWHHFWADPKSVIEGAPDEETEHQLPKEKLLLLTSLDLVTDYISACDYLLYQCIVDFLIPNVLRPIPGTLTQAIRNFAKSLETWLTNTIQGYSPILVKSKVCSVVAFSQTLRRYTSLNHLAQAARAVLQNPSQISQMLADLNRVDFANVQEQASWVCECEETLVARLEQDFKSTLQQQNSLEQWASWLESVVHTVLEPYTGASQFTKAARQFLLKWSFYSSMVIRDLTLRSAASFGSFHLIRLLYDEYMFYLIEHKVAKSSGKTPIAVMSEFSGHSRGVFSQVPSRGDSISDLPEEDEAPQIKRSKIKI